MPLDVVLAGSGLEEAFLERAVTTDIGGTEVPVIDASDLIVAKVLAGRPKDIEDARALWSLRAESLDNDRIRSVLRLLQGALDQSDLLPAFEAIARPPRRT
jgi:predicted nucleotidyltransferase